MRRIKFVPSPLSTKLKRFSYSHDAHTKNIAQLLPSRAGKCEEGAIGERSDGGAKPG